MCIHVRMYSCQPSKNGWDSPDLLVVIHLYFTLNVQRAALIIVPVKHRNSHSCPREFQILLTKGWQTKHALHVKFNIPPIECLLHQGTSKHFEMMVTDSYSLIY